MIRVNRKLLIFQKKLISKPSLSLTKAIVPAQLKLKGKFIRLKQLKICIYAR